MKPFWNLKLELEARPHRRSAIEVVLFLLDVELAVLAQFVLLPISCGSCRRKTAMDR